MLTLETVSICVLSGGESVLRGCVSGAALLQGLGSGSSHVSDGWLHAGRPLGWDHHMCPGRHAMVLGPRPPERHPLPHTSLSISAARAQPRAGRALSETLQAVQGQQEALPGAGQGGEDTQAGLWPDVRHGRRHTRGRTAVHTLARQVSVPSGRATPAR